jgi:hypothetical protein
MARRRKIDPLDATIERLYYARCGGIQINLMDIPKVFAAGRAAAARGEDIEAALVAYVETIRRN